MKSSYYKGFGLDLLDEIAEDLNKFKIESLVPKNVFQNLLFGYQQL